jgi:UDP-N-acetylmuramyl pentapeptide phosphotransferase/UDP-N-acetylglucosamine-1-phosphate transferase
LPLWLERGTEALAWIWFINLFNFMDGIDGLAGSEAIALALGYLMITLIAGLDPAFATLAICLVAAMMAYLLWNWHPARVLMGDAGSIPLGFLTGWLMLDLALRGMLPVAIILPMFFWADATSTLLRRLWHGQWPHHAHREHFYQKAALGRGDHQRVALLVVALNAWLLLLALLSTRAPIVALLIALASTALFLGQLARMAAANTRKPGAA